MNEKSEIAAALVKEISGLTEEQILELIEQPKNNSQGDYAFPVFILAKIEKRAPQQIAQQLAEKVTVKDFEKVEALGAYVNFFLDKKATAERTITEVLSMQANYGTTQDGAGRNVPIDMSSPNIAKPFSIGHLRSTVIGDALANLYKKIGYTPIKINHLGDWGKQFGLLITAYKHYGNDEAITAHPIDELLALYVKINAEAKENSEIDDEGRAWFLKLEQGDAEAQRLWKWFLEVSLAEFNRIYEILGVKFDHFTGESFYSDKMEAVVEKLASERLLVESQGAQVVDLEKYQLNPALIKRTDGATLYITRDLATAIYRKETFDFVRSLYVVGGEQANHFRQLRAVLEEAGFDWADELVHVPFGMVTQDGKKFSTRKGHVVKLELALNEAIERARTQIEEKNPNLKNKEATAQAVGVGAVKFYDLKTDRMNGYDFDLETMVSFEGETGPYVQYAHARIQSILKKASYQSAESEAVKFDGELSEDTWELVKALKRFPELVKKAADTYEPSIIAKFAISLAQLFNHYYAHVKILDESDGALQQKLALIAAIGIVLKESLALLGIEAPDEM